MKTALRWIRRLLDLALVLLVVSVLGLVLAINLAPMLGHQFVVIRGGSMEPAIHLGSVTEVSQVRPADLRPGDVVMLKETNGTLVSHRITRIVPQPDGVYVETKGDANASPDPVATPASSVVGRVDFAVPGLGYLVYLLTVPIGVLSLLGLAMTIFLAILLLEDLERESDEESELEPYESELARNLDSQPNREYVA